MLQNYTSYRLAFRLAHNGADYDEKASRAQHGHEGHHGLGASAPLQHRPEGRDRGRALPRDRSPPCWTGKAKAMVVTGSRLEAVRWQFAIDKYIKERGYKLRTLVAFSGEVRGRRQRPGTVHREQQGTEPRPEWARHPRGVQGRGVPDSTGGEQIPDRLRPAAALRHVRGPAAGGHPGRADPLAAQPGAPLQGHDLRTWTSSTTPKEILAAFQDLLRHGTTLGHNRPEPRLRPACQAGWGRVLRRLRGGARGRRWN